MDKKAVFEHYCKLLDDMRAESLAFQNFLFYTNTDEEYWEIGNAEVNCGATRAALIDHGYPYIVKWDIDHDEWGDNSCEREVAVYNEAKRCGLQKYFTEAVYLGEYKRKIRSYNLEYEYYTGMDNEDYLETAKRCECEEEEFEISISLYGYEYAECGVHTKEEGTPDQRMVLRKYKSPLTERSMTVGMNFLVNYGVEVFEKLTDFCLSFDINDLHNGNVGYINGNIVIVDFGSYHCYD